MIDKEFGSADDRSHQVAAEIKALRRPCQSFDEAYPSKGNAHFLWRDNHSEMWDTFFTSFRARQTGCTEDDGA